MAKRKRLSAPKEDFLTGPAPEVKGIMAPESMSRAPIAQVAGESSALAALDDLSRTLTEVQQEGRFVVALDLDKVDLTHLVRDRIGSDDGDMQQLKDSLRARGQQTPIEVAALPRGKFGLISGWRRMTALAALLDETGDTVKFGKVLALVRQPEAAAQAYVSMVEENEVRVGLSYYERARIVQQTVAQGAYPTTQAALRNLFASASRAKRSKIKSFLPVIEALDGVLAHPRALGERLGLKLSARLEAEPGFRKDLIRALRKGEAVTAEAEAKVLTHALSRAGEAAAPKGDEITPGVHLTAAKGRISLQGAGVDDALTEALKTWLQNR